MAREIKFRGRNILNNDWMYGDLIHDDENCRVYVYPRDAGPLELQHRVDAETIGQYTGLHDKNGREIYEGDIVRTLVSRLNATKNKKYRNFVIRYDAPHFWNGYDPILMGPMYMEVIGNIYDNPELLKED